MPTNNIFITLFDQIQVDLAGPWKVSVTQSNNKAVTNKIWVFIILDVGISRGEFQGITNKGSANISKIFRNE